MGRNAATMVIETIEGRRPEQPIVDLGFTVVERQSSLRGPSSAQASLQSTDVTNRTKW
jgi:LacI family transcriptional regulator, gluconate utilization system Gnt-I transcriptional repressor